MTISTSFPIKSCKKQSIYKYFQSISEKEVREAIIEAIMQKRGVSRLQAANTKTVRKNEVVAVLVALGDLED